VLEAGMSANLFFLRLYKKVPSTIEPYVSISSKAVRSSFFGCDFENNSPANRSVSDGALFGRIVSWQAFVGIGAEYQMRNERNQFLNFFGEVRYGQSIHNYRSIAALEQTGTRSATSCAFGVSFGMFR
jgi:hypothetical protein